LPLTGLRRLAFRAPVDAPTGTCFDFAFFPDRTTLTAPAFLTFATFSRSLQVTDVAEIRGLFGA
jgi:hypothetical protein